MTRAERNDWMRVWRANRRAEGRCHQCYRNMKTQGCRCQECWQSRIGDRKRERLTPGRKSGETAAQVEALFAKANPEKHHVTWLELSAGSSNS